jgi:glycosyltransferase involved in cell wall biosynthesis
VVSSKWYLHPLFDAVFLPGERQVQFAKRLGFQERQILRGLYCCDHERYSSVYQERKKSNKVLPAAFIYVGRMSKEKGIETLIKSYQHYRHLSKNPWPLICCGTGPMKHLLDDVEGVIPKGFVQSEDMQNMMKKATCLLLPSISEAWGVVVHEATSAGLAVICTSCCGASVHLVLDGYNGYIVKAGEAEELGNAMLRYSQLSDERKREMSDNSYNLSLQFTTKRWARYLYESLSQMLHYNKR